MMQEPEYPKDLEGRAECYVREYPKNDPRRKPAEAYLAQMVRKDIHDIREGDNTNLDIMIDALENNDPNRGFDSFNGRIGKALGKRTCQAVGLIVCQQEKFTLQEALVIMDRLRRKGAMRVGLNPDTATWVEINSQQEDY